MLMDKLINIGFSDYVFFDTSEAHRFTKKISVNNKEEMFKGTFYQTRVTTSKDLV